MAGGLLSSFITNFKDIPLPVWLWELGKYSLFQSLYLDTEYILNSKGFHILASSTLL